MTYLTIYGQRQILSFIPLFFVDLGKSRCRMGLRAKAPKNRLSNPDRLALRALLKNWLCLQAVGWNSLPAARRSCGFYLSTFVEITRRVDVWSRRKHIANHCVKIHRTPGKDTSERRRRVNNGCEGLNARSWGSRDLKTSARFRAMPRLTSPTGKAAATRVALPLLPTCVEMVGAARFELTTPCTQNRCATRLRHAPDHGVVLDSSFGNEKP